MSVTPLPWVLIPAKSLTHGKSRLWGFIGSRSRRALNLLLLRRSLSVAVQFAGPGRCVVVSPCEEVLGIAQRRGLRVIREAGVIGLNSALEQALAILDSEGDRDILLMATDMPWLDPKDLEAVVTLGRSNACLVVGSDRHGSGTNLLFLPKGLRIPLSYGLGSLQRHLSAGERVAGRALVHFSEAVAFDIDTPEDLRRWRRSWEVQGALRVPGEALTPCSAPGL